MTATIAAGVYAFPKPKNGIKNNMRYQKMWKSNISSYPFLRHKQSLSATTMLCPSVDRSALDWSSLCHVVYVLRWSSISITIHQCLRCTSLHRLREGTHLGGKELPWPPSDGFKLDFYELPHVRRQDPFFLIVPRVFWSMLTRTAASLVGL